VNHSWKYDGPRASSVARSCELCGAEGRRFRRDAGSGLLMTRWETRMTGQEPWSADRMVPCTAERKSTYVSVHVLLAARLRAEGIVPGGAELTLEHLAGDWRRERDPQHPSWLAKWPGDDGERMVFSCHPMRSCAEAPEIRMSGDQVVPVRNGEPAAGTSGRLLEIAERQTWLSRSGTKIRITSVDDDLIVYERVSGPGRDRGRLRARSLVQCYTEVAR
jgi:hypothetical protein